VTSTRAGHGADSAASGLSVDVVIDNYNYARYLEKAVESALAQTHEHVNVIVVDDGSTDDSREILSRYGDVLELVFKPNGGQASALNAGFARSRGDIVLFVDADDVLLPHAAALVASAFAADVDVVKVQYRMEVIDEQGRPRGIVKPHVHLPLLNGDVRRAELVFPFDLPWLPTSGTAFRAEALRRLMPIPEEQYRICADSYLVHLASLLGPVASLDAPGAYYRVHGGNRHEPQGAALDLRQVRQAITSSAATAHALEGLADDLGLERPYPEILSVADLSNRLVSLKLEPALHPRASDRRLRLVVDGIRASLRRFDVSWPMKLLYIAWFVTTGVAPRPVARKLADALAFPERRRTLNVALARLQRRSDDREDLQIAAATNPAKKRLN
jgi:glycosyltransferase involved in cell wall biosynthesis